MGIINRSKDISEQKDQVEVLVKDTVTGKDYLLHRAPRAQKIVDAKCLAVGMSGAPTGTLKLQRFVVGAGLTTISISGALTHSAIGTSGAQTFSLPATGSSLLNLQAGDALVMTTAVANTALEQALVNVVVQNIQDIKGWA